jgi:hypothetical protein
VAGADHRRTTTGEALAITYQYVGQRRRDRIRDVGLATGGDAGTAEHIRPAPRSCRVDHGCGEHLLAVGEADQEGCVRATRRTDAVEADPSDRGDLSAVLDPVRQLRCLRQRGEVGVDQVSAGRQVVEVGLDPGRLLQQATCGTVDVVAPRAEQLHVPPFVDRRGDARAGLEDDEVESALGELRGGREADRSGADDDDRQVLR